MEIRLKESKVDLFAQRASSKRFNANALRLNLSTFAHIHFNILRMAAINTDLAKAQPERFRLRLLKVGAIVRRSQRRLHVAMSSSFVDEENYHTIWNQLETPQAKAGETQRI